MELRKQPGIVNLTSDKIDFKPKLVKRDRKGHFKEKFPERILHT